MYEIDFHAVGNGDCSGDAISLRYWDGQCWRIGIIDGGYVESGEAVCEHVRNFYNTSNVDFVISTHPDADHISGLRIILNKLNVSQLWLHVPHLHADRIIHLFKSRKWLVENLKRELRAAYPTVEELLELAEMRGTSIRLPFQGMTIGPFHVLSPSLDLYEGLLPQFEATPQPDQNLLQQLGRWLQVGRRIATRTVWSVHESWSKETLREGGLTSAQNESSVILLGHFGQDRILLTGDAGLVALSEAVTYAASAGLQMKKPSIFQVPHHGSRNNISPSMLDFIVGPPIKMGERNAVRSVISAGREDKTHPRQVVVNALLRRGCEPNSTKSAAVLHFSGNGMPKREGWVTATTLRFSGIVEEYD
jgi:beta-lactamase superfamily II metal-dependent hydrolase